MTMYLLLRNNKQSGPYSLEELKSMGLKAYDLVWLEGKSAAWRYPCEIEELSAFAPAVEEQPFDRFYKKPAVTAAVADRVSERVADLVSDGTSTRPAAASSFAPRPTVETPAAGESGRIPGKRIIYVTMPAARTASPFRETTPAETTPTTRETRMAVPVSIPAPTAHTPAAPPQAAAPVTAIPDYTAEPVEALSQNGHSAYSHRQQPRPANSIVRFLTVGVTILALLAAGIFIGLSLNKSSLGLQPKVVAKLPPTDGSSIVHTAAQQLPAGLPAATIQNKNDSAAVTQKAADNTSAATHTDDHPAVRSNRSYGAKQKERPSLSLAGTRLIPIGKDSAINELPAHREAVHRTDAGEPNPDNSDREAVRTALANQVAVGANSYSVGAFGGINNLQLTVTNRSTYPLDLVIVEVQYIQANKKIFKTENLYFHGIGAGSALMQEAPRSSRGVKVHYRITAISSKELGLSYSGI